MSSSPPPVGAATECRGRQPKRLAGGLARRAAPVIQHGVPPLLARGNGVPPFLAFHTRLRPDDIVGCMASPNGATVRTGRRRWCLAMTKMLFPCCAAQTPRNHPDGLDGGLPLRQHKSSVHKHFGSNRSNGGIFLAEIRNVRTLHCREMIWQGLIAALPSSCLQMPNHAK
jgi:hypothetical protein